MLVPKRGWRALDRKMTVDGTRAGREKALRPAPEHCGGPIQNRGKRVSRPRDGRNTKKVPKTMHFCSEFDPPATPTLDATSPGPQNFHQPLLNNCASPTDSHRIQVSPGLSRLEKKNGSI